MGQYSKFLVALLGAAVQVLNLLLPVVPDKYKAAAGVLLAAVTAVVVYLKANDPAPSAQPAKP